MQCLCGHRNKIQGHPHLQLPFGHPPTCYHPVFRPPGPAHIMHHYCIAGTFFAPPSFTLVQPGLLLWPVQDLHSCPIQGLLMQNNLSTWKQALAAPVQKKAMGKALASTVVVCSDGCRSSWQQNTGTQPRGQRWGWVGEISSWGELKRKPYWVLELGENKLGMTLILVPGFITIGTRISITEWSSG